MTITKFEQSGLILESNNEYRVAIDIAALTPLEKLSDVKPVDVAIVSHMHADHFSIAHLAQLAPQTVLLPREVYEILHKIENIESVSEMPAGDQNMNFYGRTNAKFVFVNNGFVFENEHVKVTFFHADHGPHAQPPVDNYGCVVEMDGQSVYFAGDMFNASGIDVSSATFDYVFLPVGGHYTFGPTEALSFAKQFKHIKNLVPMHYHIRMDALPEFVELVKDEFNVITF